MRAEGEKIRKKGWRLELVKSRKWRGKLSGEGRKKPETEDGRGATFKGKGLD